MQSTQAIADSVNMAEMSVNASAQTRRLSLVCAGLAVTICSFVFAWFSTPYYSAEARILIEDWGGMSVVQNTPSGPVVLEDQALQNQFGIIASSHLLRSAGATTNLFARANAILNEDSLKLYDRLSSESGLLANLRSNLKVSKAENSRIISIQYLATDPVHAIRFTNALADSYIALLRSEILQEGSVETASLHATSLLPASARLLSRSSQTQTIWPWWIWPSLALGVCGIIGAVAAYVMPGLLAGYKKQNEAEAEIEPIRTLMMPVLEQTPFNSEEVSMQELDSIIESVTSGVEVEQSTTSEQSSPSETVWKETRLAA